MSQSMLSAPIALIETELVQSISSGRSLRSDAKFIQVRYKATVQPHRVAENPHVKWISDRIIQLAEFRTSGIALVKSQKIKTLLVSFPGVAFLKRLLHKRRDAGLGAAAGAGLLPGNA